MKITITISITLAALFFTACKKKVYLCECGGGFDGGGMKITIEKSSRGNAEAACYSHNDGINTNDGFYGCELK